MTHLASARSIFGINSDLQVPVFTESDEQCVFTVELDAGKKAPTPLVLDLELLEDAVTDSGRQALLTEEVRQYVRRTLGQ